MSLAGRLIFLESTGTFIDLETEQPEARKADSESDLQSISASCRGLAEKNLNLGNSGGFEQKRARPLVSVCVCTCLCTAVGGGGGVAV